MAGFDNDVVYGQGIDLSGSTPVTNKLADDGYIYFGNSAGNPVAGLPTSSDGSITITPLNGGLDLKAASTPSANINNLGISYSSGTFTLTGFDGTSLSTSNKGSVRTQNNSTPGQNLLLELSKVYSFRDDSHATNHDLEGWHVGMNDGDDWDEDRPFFLYVVSNNAPGSTPAVAISLTPHASISPSLSRSNKSGSISSSKEYSFFYLNIDGTAPSDLDDYDSNPCVCIGSFRMQTTDTANNDWTVQALDIQDGINNLQFDRVFRMPDTGVKGAATNTFFDDNGGTAPSFTNNYYKYRFSKGGFIYFDLNFAPCTTSGTGAYQALIVAPYNDFFLNYSSGYWNNKATTYHNICPRGGGGLNYITMFREGSIPILKNEILNTSSGDIIELGGVMAVRQTTA